MASSSSSSSSSSYFPVFVFVFPSLLLNAVVKALSCTVVSSSHCTTAAILEVCVRVCVRARACVCVRKRIQCASGFANHPFIVRAPPSVKCSRLFIDVNPALGWLHNSEFFSLDADPSPHLKVGPDARRHNTTLPMDKAYSSILRKDLAPHPPPLLLTCVSPANYCACKT